MKIEIIKDSSNEYASGTVMDASMLIDEYISGLNENEDNDKEAIESLSQDEEWALKYIGYMWGIEYKIIE